MNVTCATLATTLKALTAAATIAVTGQCPAYLQIAKAPAGTTLDFTAAPLVRLDADNLSNITLKGIVAKGSQYQGLNVIASKNVLVVAPKIDHPGTVGIAITNSDSVEVQSPLITNSAADGVDIAGSSNVYIHDGACALIQPAPGAHPDCVQMWSYNGLASHDITVARMTISGPTQGIDNFGSNTPALYRISVLNNTISTNFSNCIALGGVSQAVVTGNRCITLPGGTTGPALVKVYCPTATNPYGPCAGAVVSNNTES